MTAKERQQLEDVLQRIDKVNNELMALDDGPVDMDSLMQALEALSIKINDILEEAAGGETDSDKPPVTPHKKTAHWIGEEYDGYADRAPVYTSWVCSECGATFMCEDMDFLYCPRCGRVMEV